LEVGGNQILVVASIIVEELGEIQVGWKSAGNGEHQTGLWKAGEQSGLESIIPTELFGKWWTAISRYSRALSIF